MEREIDGIASRSPAPSRQRELPVLMVEPNLPADGMAFEHGTDDELIAGRLQAARPLATQSPHPGNVSSSLRREVLYALRTGGPAAPDQVADSIGASRTGVLQQLRTLEMAGLVSKTVIRHGVGRPRHVYDLTLAAQELFPANYGALAQAVLSAVVALGGDDLVEEVFEARRMQLKARMSQRLAERLPANASLWEKVREVARFQDENGYLGRASRADDGTILLTEHNCAIFEVSGRYRAACAAEEKLFGEVLGAKISRECHIASGGRACTYRVTPANGADLATPTAAPAAS